MKQINQKDLKKIRKHFHRKQRCICPILKMKFNAEDMVCDHAHSSNAKNLGKSEESGLIRGIIHRQANTMEGKITNSFIRCGLHKFDITLPDFLRSLADFIENPPMTYLEYVHPSEKAKPKKLKKNSVKKLLKLFRIKYPNKIYPKYAIYKERKKGKGMKLGKQLERLFAEFNLKPEFRK